MDWAAATQKKLTPMTAARERSLVIYSSLVSTRSSIHFKKAQESPDRTDLFAATPFKNARSLLMFHLFPRAHTLAKKLLYLIFDDDCYVGSFKLALWQYGS
jgi:hypothetical protein